jgi:transposase
MAMVLQVERRVKYKLRALRRDTRDKGLASRCQIVLLAARGWTRTRISDALSCSVSWISRVVGRFRALGIAGLIDRREDNGPNKLDEPYLATLYALVDQSPCDHGYARPTWTRELLVDVMARQTGVRIHPATMSRALAMNHARRGRPRPVLRCPWPNARKNKVLAAIAAMITSRRPHEAVVYLDEVDIHLNPKIGLDWMNRGTQKEVVTPGKNGKRYVCGAQAVGDGTLTWVLGDRKNSLLFIAMLRHLLSRYRRTAMIHVVLDNYAVHHSRQVRAWLAEHGQRLRLHFLPPYCPQHNRIERLWLDLHAQVTRNHTCRTIDELVEQVVQFLSTRTTRRKRKAA